MALTIIQTKDNSPTLRIEELDEHYHSIHGAFSESMHVFLKMGLDTMPANISPLRILEVGFGTGLNAFLTCLEAEKSARAINYTSLEPFPIGPGLADQLNYPGTTGHSEKAPIFTCLHTVPWEKPIEITEFFCIHKLRTTLQDFESQSKFHLVYFDAFAPGKQPELWTEDIFQKMHTLLEMDGVLVTYSAKGTVKRALQTAGFKVKKVPGPPGKREMLRAQK